MLQSWNTNNAVFSIKKNKKISTKVHRKPVRGEVDGRSYKECAIRLKFHKTNFIANELQWNFATDPEGLQRNSRQQKLADSGILARRYFLNCACNERSLTCSGGSEQQESWSELKQIGQQDRPETAGKRISNCTIRKRLSLIDRDAYLCASLVAVCKPSRRANSQEKDERKKSVDVILRSATERCSYAREMLRDSRWRCETRVAKGRIPLDLKHYPRKSPKKPTQLCTGFYTIPLWKTRPRISWNRTLQKNPIQHLISNKGKYSIEAYKTEWVCSWQYCIEIRLYRDSDTRQNEPEYVRDSKISQGTKRVSQRSQKQPTQWCRLGRPKSWGRCDEEMLKSKPLWRGNVEVLKQRWSKCSLHVFM